MARTHRTDYVRSNRTRSVPLPNVADIAEAASRLLSVSDAAGRRLFGQHVLATLARQTGVTMPELVVPDEPQPHRRARGRIVFSQQGEYRRRQPGPDDPKRTRSGKPIGRIRIHNRTPARGVPVRPTAFLHTLLHEFCHHHDVEALDIQTSLHTSGFFARVRHLREQLEAGSRRAAVDRRTGQEGPAADGTAAIRDVPLGLERLWSIIRTL